MSGNANVPGQPEKVTTDRKFRNAHRFAQKRTGVDQFNPFRHILWESKVTEDPELGHVGGGKKWSSEGEKKSISILGFQFHYPLPEKPFTVSNQIRNTLLTSWINLFLVFLPIGLGLRYSGGSSVSTFTCNYLAEFPLWFLSDYAMEEIEHYLGYVASDLLDIFTSNMVQIISSVVLLRAGQIDLLQTSLIGGILSNLLFLLGLSIMLGGMPGVGQHMQQFNRISAQGSSSLLSIAATSLLIPTAVEKLGQTTQRNLVLQSRGVSAVLLLVYVIYIIYQMGTHKKENMDSGKKNAPSEQTDGSPLGLLTLHIRGTSIASARRPSTGSGSRVERAISQTGAEPAIEPVLRRNGISLPEVVSSQGASEPILPSKSQHEIRGPHLHFLVALFVFAASIVLLYFVIDATVDSISALTDQTALSATFVGLILLPIPNCDFAPISLAVDDFLQQTMKYTVGRSIQTALLVEPMAVLIAWWMGVDGVTLAFSGFEVVSLFTTILLLNFLVVDAQVHWVHGVLLLAEWVLIGIAAYFVTP